MRCNCGRYLDNATPRIVRVSCPDCGTEHELPPSDVVSTGPVEIKECCGQIEPPTVPDITKKQREHWRKLHRFAFTEQWNCSLRCKRWEQWQASIPNFGCNCKQHWQRLIEKHQPTFRSREAFFEWSVLIHNAVNAELDKPQISIEAAMEAHGIHPDWPETQQPMTDRLVAVTSLSPLAKHQETQPAALDSWRLAGLAIVAVNTRAEIEALRPLYPQVSRWVESADQCPAYSFPTQRINALCSAVTDSPFLLINSDIQLRGDQQRLFDILDSGKVGVGIRHNYVGHWRSAEREGWGIDAFLMTPAQAATLPQLPFAIGRPMWDYWLPYHFDHIGQPMEWIGEPYFYHAAHRVHWDRSDLELGRSWLEQQYGVIEDWLSIRDRWPFPPPHHKSIQKPSTCVVCKEPATRICSYTLSLGMCGYPLCDDCTHAHTL